MSARNMAQRTAAGTLALAVCLGGGALALAGAANADANFKFDTRISGDDRYATAIEASKAAFPDAGKTENVILVNGYATVDGLTASYLAGVANAPILYVSDKGADDATKAEIKRLGVKKVWLVGGTTVIPTSVETAIKGDGYSVERINGSDRYETAKLIAAKGAELSGKKPSKVFVASGTSFADALAVSPIAYAKHYAIALTEKDSTSQYTKDELGAIGTDAKILVGGEAVVSKKVQADLSIKDEQRIAGADRAVTANLVSDWAKKSEGFNVANAALVGGTNGNGADSLVASALGAKSLTTLHFAGWDATYTYLKDHAAELTGKGFVFGGKAAVAGDQVDKATSAAQTVVSNQAITVTGGSDKAVSSATYSASDDKTYVSYTASVPSGVDSVSIRLVAPSDVKNNGGAVSFTKEDNYLRADFTDENGEIGQAVIKRYNSSIANAAYVDDVPVTDGKVTFRVAVSGENTAGSVVPVVFQSTKVGGVGRLPVDANGKPTAKVGVGSKTTFAPDLTPSGPSYAAKVQSVDGNKFTATYSSGAAAGVFVFKSDDTFTKVGGAAISSDIFAGRLSVGDTVTVANYLAPGAAGTRTTSFELTDDKVDAPTNVVGAPYDNDLDGTPDGVKLTYTAAATNLQSGAGAAEVKYATVAADGSIGTWTNAASATVSYSGKTGTIDLGSLSSGTYVYKVHIKGLAGSSFSEWSDASQPFKVGTTGLSSVASAPVSTVISYVEAGTANNLVDTGDAITITFNEPIAVPTSDASITLADTDSPSATVASITNGVNATFTRVGSSNNQLKIVLTAPPSISTPGTTAGLGYGGDISAASGIKDLDSTPQSWSLVDGELTTPGSTVVVRVVTSASNLNQTASSFAGVFDQSRIAATRSLVPGSTVTLEITASGTSANVGKKYSATVSATGTFSVAAPLVAAGDTISVTQSIANAGTSSAKTGAIS